MRTFCFGTAIAVFAIVCVRAEVHAQLKGPSAPRGAPNFYSQYEAFAPPEFFARLDFYVGPGELLKRYGTGDAVKVNGAVVKAGGARAKMINLPPIPEHVSAMAGVRPGKANSGLTIEGGLDKDVFGIWVYRIKNGKNYSLGTARVAPKEWKNAEGTQTGWILEVPTEHDGFLVGYIKEKSAATTAAEEP